MRTRFLRWIVPLALLSQAALAQTYGLRNLQPIGLSQKSEGNDRHALLHFRNEQGDQFILYEENAAYAGVREIAGLITFLGNPGRACSIDLDCQQKAFCTAECKKAYYEVFNSAAPAGRNSCTIKAFSCGPQNGGP